MPASGSGSPGHRKRLRERFLRSSLEGFHDYEVVELLLTFAIPRRDVKPLAKALVARFKGLSGIFEASAGELMEVTGCGERSVELIALLKEAASVYVNEKAAARPPVRSAADVVCFVNDHSKEYGEGAERLFALFLNSKNEILGIELLHEGEMSGALVQPRAVMEKAFGHNARSIIFVHTADGQASPSRGERSLAEGLEAAARSIDILVHDHIIVGKKNFLSARDLGWLRPGPCP
jgi:DNA repair protein RadC